MWIWVTKLLFVLNALSALLELENRIKLTFLDIIVLMTLNKNWIDLGNRLRLKTIFNKKFYFLNSSVEELPLHIVKIYNSNCVATEAPMGTFQQ